MRLPPLEVTDPDRVVLERRARSKTASQRDVTRARVVLMAAAGKSNNAIADVVGINTRYVGMWRKRYEAEGLDGLNDRPRPGRPLIYGHDDRLRIVRTICETRPRPSPRRAGPWTRCPKRSPTKSASRPARSGASAVASISSRGRCAAG